MMFKKKTLSLIVCWLTAVATDARVGVSDRRRLQHRKLQWAADEVAIENQYIVVFKDDQFDANEELDFVSEWVNNGWSETSVLQEFRSVYRGVVLTNLPLFTLKEVVEDDRVAWVEEVRLHYDRDVLEHSICFHADSALCSARIKQCLRRGLGGLKNPSRLRRMILRPGDWIVSIRHLFLWTTAIHMD